MSTVTKLLTADDLWQIPDDGLRHELVKGELRTSPLAGFAQGIVGNQLSACLGNFVKAHKLGLVVATGTGFVLEKNPDTVRAPDIGFIRQERLDATGIPKKYWPGAPDLAVEVVSPGDTVYEVEGKVEQWLEAGTGLVWVVNPRRRTVTVHQADCNPIVLTAKDELDGQNVIPGFRVRVGVLFFC